LKDAETMNATSISIPTAPTAPQSCLQCRRFVTKREQHDAFEARLLEMIRAQHPEWAESDSVVLQVEHYRALLQRRKRRSSRERAERLRERVRRYRVRARLRGLAGSMKSQVITL
jgi:primosomal protein N''